MYVQVPAVDAATATGFMAWLRDWTCRRQTGSKATRLRVYLNTNVNYTQIRKRYFSIRR
jgi:hypothetical protein